VKTLPLTVGTIAALDDKLVVICSTQPNGITRVRNIATGVITKVSLNALSNRKSTLTERTGDALHNRLTHATDDQVETARRREATVLNALATDDSLKIAVAREAHRIRVGARTIWRWIQRYRAWPSLEALLPQGHGGHSNQRRLRAELETVITASIDEVFLTQPKGSYQAVYERVRQRCVVAGLKSPSKNAVIRRLKAIDPWLVAQRQLGREEAARKLGPKPGSLREKQPLAIVQIDHTLVDIQVVDDIHRKTIGRPWITLAIDVATRCITGFHLSLEAPSVASVAACISLGCQPKDRWLELNGIDTTWPIWGLPHSLQADNAREFKTEALSRGCAEWGIDMKWRPLGRPHYGGHIERLIGTLMGRIHLLPGTTQSNPQKLGRYKAAKAAQLTLSELERWIAIEICERYHANVHRSLRCAPLHAWQDWFAERGNHPAIPGNPERFRISFMPLVHRSLQRQGLTFMRIQYWDNVLPSIAKPNEPVLVRYDPRDLSRLFVLDSNGRYWPIPYADLRLPPVTLAEVKAANAVQTAQEKTRGFGYQQFEWILKQREVVQNAATKTKSARRTQQRRLEAERGTNADARRPQSSGIRFDVDPPEFEVEYWGDS